MQVLVPDLEMDEVTSRRVEIGLRRLEREEARRLARIVRHRAEARVMI